MSRLRAWLWGVLEFRTSFTRSMPHREALEAYDRGREFAHRVTRRRYER